MGLQKISTLIFLQKERNMGCIHWFSILLLFFHSTNASFNLINIDFGEGYSNLFGDKNILLSPDGQNVRLLLDRYSGSGFISTQMYNHGFFSAMIKLPSDYTAGICVAFYTSNGDVFQKSHDELDFEFLGNVQGKPWKFQTNMYGNGSTNRGREERYYLWFDPSEEFHRYSILWTAKNIIFYIDEIPIREVVRNDAMKGDYPSKPMSLYATIWDASDWATSGGKYKADYRYQPFVAEFTEFVLEGCPVYPIQEFPFVDCSKSDTQLASKEFSTISPDQRAEMHKFRESYMFYSYCYDIWRYPVAPPECARNSSEQLLFKENGRLKKSQKLKSKPRKGTPVAR